jgi:hypothetical protein
MTVTNTRGKEGEDREAIAHMEREPSPSLYTIGCEIITVRL